MAPKHTEVDPTMEQLQQEMGKITTMLVEQRQGGERVKSLELAMVAVQKKLESFSFLEQMQQRFFEEEEEKRRLMAMVRGKMLQLEQSPAEKGKGGDVVTGDEEKSATGVASTTKEPEANKAVRGETSEPCSSETTSQDPANFFFATTDRSIQRRMEVLVFDGENAKSWVLRVEQYFELGELTKEQKLKAVRMCFDGEALMWYRWERVGIL